MSRILKENMMHYNGVGLSANQIGIGERVYYDVEYGNRGNNYCSNPRIVKRYGGILFWFEEGCLSFDEIM